MNLPEQTHALSVGEQLTQLRQDLAAFDLEMREAGVADRRLRERLAHWLETRFGGRILDRGEKVLRAIQGRN